LIPNKIANERVAALSIVASDYINVLDILLIQYQIRLQTKQWLLYRNKVCCKIFSSYCPLYCPQNQLVRKDIGTI